MVISHLAILAILVLSFGAGPAAAGQNPPTLRKLKQAVAANPQDPQAHYALGLQYENQGAAQKAAAEYRQALALKPDDQKMLYSLGRLMGQQGQLDQAVDIAKKAIKLNSNFAEARTLLAATYNKQGTALLLSGDLDAAKEAFEAGIRAQGDPAATEALRNNLGCLYVRENRLQEATDAFREVLNQNQDSAEAHYNLALLYYTQGDYQAASREMFALKGIDPGMAGELSDYRFRIQTSTDWSPPVKTQVTFKGSPLLTQGTITSY
jgi:tetratricopeptide (TPR) repeat protein